MPSKSAKQARTMRAAKHNPEFARKVGIPQDVAADYVAADRKEGKYADGGIVGAGNAAPRSYPKVKVSSTKKGR
jgi:hypothetical protein